jgi:hypothetical protein
VIEALVYAERRDIPRMVTLVGVTKTGFDLAPRLHTLDPVEIELPGVPPEGSTIFLRKNNAGLRVTRSYMYADDPVVKISVDTEPLTDQGVLELGFEVRS